MDIHRCRFVGYPPATINTLAFSHPHAQSYEQASSARLAIGRENGDIEIWNPLSGTWLQEKVIHGGLDRSVDGLVWVVEPDQTLADGKVVAGRPRLFSIGSSSTITEWNLLTGAPKRHATGNHGEIWCLAAQPVPVRKQKQGSTPKKPNPQVTPPVTRLLAGTIKGELISYSIEDDTLRFDKVVVRAQTKKHQLLSIAFANAHTAVVGCSDSTIRVYDIRKGMMVRTMTLGSDLAGGSKDIIVWSVKCLPDGDIVSADSTGQICIWDGKTFTQTQRLQSHESDALSLAVNASGSMIVSGGMDRRTIFYQKVAGSRRWGKVWGRKYHDHDVKAMASFETGNKSIVVSGGPDAAPVVVPMREMGRENHRRLPHLPQQPPLLSAPQARFMVSWWDQEVQIWLIKRPPGPELDQLSGGGNINENRKLLKKILLDTESNISSAVISSDGTFLAVSSAAAGVKAFHLRHDDPSVPADVQVSTIKTPDHLMDVGPASLTISPDGRYLCAVSEGTEISVTRIQPADASDSAPPTLLPKAQRLRRLRRDVPRHKLLGGLGSYNRSIARSCFSPDSRMLAVVDLAGYIDTWVLRGKGDDPAQNGDDDDDARSTSSSSSDDSDSDSDEETANSATGPAGKWVRNPAAGQLPKLSSTPVVLSFAPDVPRQHPATDNTGVDATEVHDDYVLLAVTAPFDVLAFNPLRGSLTPWSRRNRTCLPPEMVDTKDVAKGAFWHGTRAWIYGPTFVFMLDMSVDTGIEPAAELSTTTAGKKRKRPNADSGAGSKMEVGSLGPHKVYKVDGASKESREFDNETKTAANPRTEDGEDEDDEMEDVDAAQPSELEALRKKEGGETTGTVSAAGKTPWHRILKYRPIMGIVPLGVAAGEEGREQVEVALVERPHWDIDLPERYAGSKEKTYY